MNKLPFEEPRFLEASRLRRRHLVESRNRETLDRTRVLYIMGEGRSGSTLLDILLSCHEEVVGAGELWGFFTENPDITGRCSCGQQVRNCELWSKVRDVYLSKLVGRSLREVHNTRTEHDRLRRLPLKLTGAMGSGFKDYCSDMTMIFDTLREVGDRSTVIDSSKQITRSLNLLRCPELEVFLIHLVRDGRGVLWSRMRDLERNPQLKRPLWRIEPFFSIVAWTVKNTLAQAVGERAKGKYILVRYEDLMSRPAVVLEEIGELCGLDMSVVSAQLTGDQAILPGHQIGGNELVRLGNRRVRLNPDYEWTRLLPRRSRALFFLGAGWLARKYGYPRTVKAPPNI